MPKLGWFAEFVMTHVGRFPRDDWNDVDPIFWQSLEALFLRRGVAEHEAYEASARLFDAPPDFIGDHPAKLIAAVEAIWRERNAKGPVNADIARQREADAAENARFDRAAELNWHRTPEDEREVWRDLVRKKLPELCARGDWWLDGLAKGWAYDPTLVVGDPPPRPTNEPRKHDTPRTPFVDVPTPQPQGA